jgi:hypothetical protein
MPGSWRTGGPVSLPLDGANLAGITPEACKMGLEGIVSKRLSAPYRSGLSRDWIKVKNPNSELHLGHVDRRPRQDASARAAASTERYARSRRLRPAARHAPAGQDRLTTAPAPRACQRVPYTRGAALVMCPQRLDLLDRAPRSRTRRAGSASG